MPPGRRSHPRRLRLALASAVTLLLAGALMYTTFSASTEARTPSQLVAAAEPGRTYELTGMVRRGSIERSGNRLRFRIRDRDGAASLPVVYQGVVPDPFREGREVIVSGRLEGGIFRAERDSLVTKCPSKFTKTATRRGA
jgi:cytochrome c-type biogenesis protein CcmE